MYYILGDKLGDAISRKALCEYALNQKDKIVTPNDIMRFPSIKLTLYGYDIEHLELIARVLIREHLSPDRVAEALTDISRIVELVRQEFEDELNKQVTQALTTMKGD